MSAPVSLELDAGGDGDRRSSSSTGEMERGVERFDCEEPRVATVSGEGGSAERVK